MEEVANNVVSETPVLEGVALKELKALLNLQMKMFIEGMDELFAKRNAKLDARLCPQSDARASEGSEVLDAAAAQEAIPDLDLATAATSATNAEPSNINTGALTTCSTKFQNRVVDVPMPFPASTVAEEIVPDVGLAAAVSSATNTEPSDINIGTPSRCSTEFSNLAIVAATPIPVCTFTVEIIPAPDHVAAATSAISVETTAMFGHNYMESRHQASATSTTIDKELFLDPILAADASSAMGIEQSTIHIGVPITCSTKCSSAFIDITAPAAVDATAEEVTLDLFHAPSGVGATACIDIILSMGLVSLWMMVCLPTGWTSL